jgi:pimeloyl-ACP methyl ester carboxylesterase
VPRRPRESADRVSPIETSPQKRVELIPEIERQEQRIEGAKAVSSAVVVVHGVIVRREKLPAPELPLCTRRAGREIGQYALDTEGSAGMAAIVLVHGTFVDSTCWSEVAAGLRELGHRVEAPDLHRGSLEADTAAVQAVIDDLDGVAVACGWSYGGMVITGLDLRVGSHLVYLCSLMPDEQETVWTLSGDFISAIDADVLLEATDAGELVVSGSGIDALFWPDAPAHRAEAVRRSMRPQVASTYFTPAAKIAWKDAPSTYVAGRSDQLFGHLSVMMAARAANAVTWETSHSPVLSRPDLVIELLDDLSRQPAP